MKISFKEKIVNISIDSYKMCLCESEIKVLNCIVISTRWLWESETKVLNCIVFLHGDWYYGRL